MDFKEFCKSWQPFDEYKVHIKLKDIAGGIPKNEDLLAGWLQGQNKKFTEEERQKIVEATREQLDVVTEEKEDLSGTCFKRDDTGLFIEGRQVKAMLKECANIIKDAVPSVTTTKNKSGLGIAALKNHTSETVFVVEDKIHLLRDGKPVQEKDETEKKPIHVMTPRGARDSIKLTDKLYGVEVEFTVRRMAKSKVSEKALYAALIYAQYNGLGANRSQGCGQFEVLSCEKTAKSQLVKEKVESKPAK